MWLLTFADATFLLIRVSNKRLPSSILNGYTRAVDLSE